MGVIATAMAIFMVGGAIAAGTWNYYNLTVPKLGGEAYTNNLTKQYGDGYFSIRGGEIGGNYDLITWLEKSDFTDESYQGRINDYTQIRLYSWAQPGYSVHMTLKSDYSDYVNIQAYGDWSPDTPPF